MNIISWNLNHRTQPKPIPHGVIRFLAGCRPDVAVFNEFVDAPSRHVFYAEAAAAGYGYRLLSKQHPGHNQILILSNLPIEPGDIEPPSRDEAAESNFLHVKVAGHELEIIGLRAPAYKSKAQKDVYWADVTTIAKQNVERKIIFIGDLNFNPFLPSSAGAARVPFGLEERYYVPNPEGAWSFISTDGTRSSRIDHAIVSDSAVVSEARYLTEWEGLTLAGPQQAAAISDHAVLSLQAR